MIYDVVPFAGNIWVLNYEETALVPLYTNDQIKYYNLNITDFPIMQYTELKDKRKHEIWEGDIVNIYHRNITNDYDVIVLFKTRIYSNQGCFGFYDKYRGEFITLHHSIYSGNIIEVIGNLYENPELLKA